MNNLTNKSAARDLQEEITRLSSRVTDLKIERIRLLRTVNDISRELTQALSMLSKAIAEDRDGQTVMDLKAQVQSTTPPKQNA